jgi:hypothetical protein
MDDHLSQFDHSELKQTKHHDDSGLPLTVAVFLVLAIAILSVMGLLVLK